MNDISNLKSNSRPTHQQAQEAVKTILRYIGENPEREGLKDTPKRVVESYSELFSGYADDPERILGARFFETANFQDFVLLKTISFKSFCEHHMLPMSGHVDVAYIPDGCVVGISKLARVVEIFAKRLQIQEKMTVEIAEAIQNNLQPLGVAVKISATHSCMTERGVLQDSSIMETMHYTGVFVDDPKYRQEFLNLIK